MALLVTAESVAARLSIPLPLPEAVKTRIEAAIEDSQGKVHGFLGRPLEAVEQVLTGLWADERYSLSTVDAWPQAKRAISDRFSVVSYEVNADDGEYFDVTFLVGLDVANDPELAPILRFIAQDAKEDLRLDALFVKAAGITRAVASVSAGGQSVSYESSKPGDATAAGAPLTLASLRRWKRKAIYQQPMVKPNPWPYAYRH